MEKVGIWRERDREGVRELRIVECGDGMLDMSDV